MKIYISGKMRGLPEEESRKLFKAAENYLIELGHDVINPWDSEGKKMRSVRIWMTIFYTTFKFSKRVTQSSCSVTGKIVMVPSVNTHLPVADT